MKPISANMPQSAVAPGADRVCSSSFASRRLVTNPNQYPTPTAREKAKKKPMKIPQIGTRSRKFSFTIDPHQHGATPPAFTPAA